MRKKQVIAVDLDDVLAANAEGFIAFSNERWGTSLTVDDYIEHWAELWKVDHEETKKRSKEFHGSGVVSSYRHYEEAKPVLETLKTTHKLVIVTSRRMQIEKETLAWIDTYYNGIFDEIHFAGIWDKDHIDAHKVTKAEIVAQIGADFLIDDQLKHCESAAGAGIKALLFGNYKWNQAANLPRGVVRVDNWQEVLEYFDGSTRA